ncbi:hypothetical protein ACFVUW_30095 [Streptomyces xiamenensis]|uniref:hypothetical protein n=1 Tax=Streptomyces xiamenensis TaxID=408015 RepID=UPI0036EB55B2
MDQEDELREAAWDAFYVLDGLAVPGADPALVAARDGLARVLRAALHPPEMRDCGS